MRYENFREGVSRALVLKKLIEGPLLWLCKFGANEPFFYTKLVLKFLFILKRKEVREILAMKARIGIGQKFWFVGLLLLLLQCILLH